MNYTLLIITLVGLVLAGQVAWAHGDAAGKISDELVQINPAPGENYHLEIKPQTLEGYRIPNMDISVTITNTKTGETSVEHLHGMFGGNYHYGGNIALPAGVYNLAFHLDPPVFMREGGRANSWIEPVEADFNFTAVNDPKEGSIIGEKVTEDMKIIFEMETAEPMWALPAAPAPEPVTAAAPSDTSNKIFFAALTLIVGGALGFFFGKSRRAAV